MEIGANVVIRPGTELYANTKKRAKIIIEYNVLIGPNVMITVSNHNYENPEALIMNQGGSTETVNVKEGAWIGAIAIILSKVDTIGRNSVVGARSVVTKAVPDYCAVAGVPAKVIRTLDR